YPSEAFIAADRVIRDQLAAVLFRKVDQDRGGFEQGEGLAAGGVGIDQRRDPVIGGDLQKFRLELVTGADVDRDHLVFETELFECYVHLVAIGGRPGPDFEHVRVSGFAAVTRARPDIRNFRREAEALRSYS